MAEEFETNPIIMRVPWTYISREMIADKVFPIIKAGDLFPKVSVSRMSDEEIAEREAKRKAIADEQQREADAKHQVIITAYTEQSAVLEVLSLHKPEMEWDGFLVCRGCDFAGWDPEPPGYPCSTVTLLRTLAGIEP